MNTRKMNIKAEKQIKNIRMSKEARTYFTVTENDKPIFVSKTLKKAMKMHSKLTESYVTVETVNQNNPHIVEYTLIPNENPMSDFKWDLFEVQTWA